MESPEVHESTEATRSPARAAAESWAEFTKALSIYPESNVRVRTLLESLLATLAQARSQGAGGPVSVLFRGGKVEANGEASEIDGRSNLAWLRARLDRAALSGAAFAENVDEAALIAFTKHLLGLYLNQVAHPRPQDLWPETFPGIDLIDLRFEGGFGGSGGGDGSGAGGGGTGIEDVVGLLMADGAIAGRLAELSLQPAQSDDPDEQVSARQLLERIVAGMPAEALDSREALVKATADVLESLRAQDGEGGTAAPAALGEARLGALLQSVSRSHFARGGPDLSRWAREQAKTEGDAQPARGAGRSGDEGIDGSLDELLAEVERLPRRLAVKLDPASGEGRAEQLATCLHYLMNMEGLTRPTGLVATLDALLANAGEEEIHVLRECILKEREDQGQGKRKLDANPLLRYLRGTGHVQLLKRCGLLTPDWVVETFPTYFTAYIEAINPTDASARREFVGLCERLGAERMLAARDELSVEGGTVTHEVVESLLRGSSPALLPFARLLLTWYGKPSVPAVAKYLRRLDLPEQDVFLLYFLPDAGALTAEYLQSVIDAQLGIGSQAVITECVSRVLCAYIERMKRVAPLAEHRIECIRQLTNFRSDESAQLLRELTRWFWIPILRREPLLVAREARNVQKQIAAA
jgi:hypothetical protein